MATLVMGKACPGYPDWDNWSCFEYWLARYQPLIAGLLALAGAAWTVRAVRGQVDEQRRLFIHQMHVQTARERAVIGRLIERAIGALGHAERKVQKTLEAIHDGRVATDAELSGVVSSLREAAGRVRNEKFKEHVTGALYEERHRRRIELFIQRADQLANIERAQQVRSELASEDLLNEILDETRRAIEAVKTVRGEIESWVNLGP